ETFAASFAGQKGGIADAMNNMPKVVVSKTLAKAEWQNSVLIKGTDELSKLKQQQGRNIGVSGSPTLVRALIREGLLDQLQLNDLPDRVGQRQAALRRRRQPGAAQARRLSGN
ncbi:MAG: dihydrofolate reductase, partial [Chloroflexi bacterium]